MNMAVACGARAQERKMRYAEAPVQSPTFKFLAFDRGSYQRVRPSLGDPAWLQLRASYDDLPADAYLPAGESYRFRRFGRFRYNRDTRDLSALPWRPFFQARDFNALNGGIERHFAPLAPAIQRNRALYELIDFNGALLEAPHPDIAVWTIFIHQIRIVADSGAAGKPTPEGIHQDGHWFVAQILIARENATGAQSRIYNPRKELLTCTVLSNPLDSLLVNDKAVFHKVTALHCRLPGQPAYRDMLLIDFNPYDEFDQS
jgi:hypothetical protein